MICDRDCFNCKYDDCIDGSGDSGRYKANKKYKDDSAKEHRREYMKRYYRENKEKIDKYRADWRAKHPDYYKEYRRKIREV